jgi:medium-chain acyl-[acyl-carrier-protein] hydrolase
MRLHEYPGWREELEVQTWPSGFRRLFALRQWRLLHRGRQIGEAASAWLMVDNQARRPIRPETLATWGDYIREERALEHDFVPLPGLDGAPGPEQEFRVRFGDVDVNGHAGYLSYVDWVLETVPARVRARGRLAELEIHYLAEVSHGERIRARSQPFPAPPGATGYLHSLVHGEDEGEACRARTVWVASPADSDAIRPAGG